LAAEVDRRTAFGQIAIGAAVLPDFPGRFWRWRLWYRNIKRPGLFRDLDALQKKAVEADDFAVAAEKSAFVSSTRVPVPSKSSKSEYQEHQRHLCLSAPRIGFERHALYLCHLKQHQAVPIPRMDRGYSGTLITECEPVLRKALL
jgi:hypothetical protein